MLIQLASYTIYHSPNCYLGSVLAERAFESIPVSVERRPIYIPRSRGVLVADLVGSKETAILGSYHQEDCARWSRKYAIPIQLIDRETFFERASKWSLSTLDREELPARAYYAAAGSGREAEFDRALFRAAWVDALDVNEESVVRSAARDAGLDPDSLIERALLPETKTRLEAALDSFQRDRCPGVPTWVLNGERFWGKDRVELLAEALRALTRIGDQGV